MYNITVAHGINYRLYQDTPLKVSRYPIIHQKLHSYQLLESSLASLVSACITSLVG